MTYEKSSKKKNIEAIGGLSSGAELFRSKLINVFRLLDTIGESKQSNDIPKLNTADLITPEKYGYIMTNTPHALVRFQLYNNRVKKVSNHALNIASVDRRRNRLVNKNRKFPPAFLFAHWIVNNSIFQNFIIAIIFLNTIFMAIHAEIVDSTDPMMMILRLALDIFDSCTLVIFCMEILIKWVNNFDVYWDSSWNIFDFVITLMTLAAEGINLYFGRDNQDGNQMIYLAHYIRTCRILRSLKLVTRFEKIRFVTLAITKAFKEMVFIAMLLLVFAYIFAVVGVIFFGGHKHNSDRQSAVASGHKTYDSALMAQLTARGSAVPVNVTTRQHHQFADSFVSMKRALITLFQLFTLDRWVSVYKDISTEDSSLYATIYITIWILLGAFIFRNIFVGIMVNNFQNIRNDLYQENQNKDELFLREEQLVDFTDDLNKKTKKTQDKSHKYKNKDKEEEEVKEWRNIMENNLNQLVSEPQKEVCWPRDTLFRYLQLQESLQDNLDERSKLLQFAAETMTAIHDT